MWPDWLRVHFRRLRRRRPRNSCRHRCREGEAAQHHIVEELSSTRDSADQRPIDMQSIAHTNKSRCQDAYIRTEYIERVIRLRFHMHNEGQCIRIVLPITHNTLIISNG